MYYIMDKEHKIHPIRLSEEVWAELNRIKGRGVSWDKLLTELIFEARKGKDN
jgi:hypothetical protein